MEAISTREKLDATRMLSEFQQLRLHLFKYAFILFRLTGFFPRQLLNFEMNRETSKITILNWVQLIFISVNIIFLTIKLVSHLLITQHLSHQTFELCMRFLQAFGNLVAVTYLLLKQDHILELLYQIYKRFLRKFQKSKFKKIRNCTMFYMLFLVSSHILYDSTIIYRFSTFSNEKMDRLFHEEFSFLPGNTSYSSFIKRFSMSIHYMMQSFFFGTCGSGFISILSLAIALIFQEIIVDFGKQIRNKNLKTILCDVHSAKYFFEKFEILVALPLFILNVNMIGSLLFIFPSWLLMIEKGFINGIGNFTGVIIACINFSTISYIIAGIQVKYENFVTEIRFLLGQPNSARNPNYVKMCEQFDSLFGINFKMKVFHFFTVDRGLVLTVLSGVVTFAVLLKQFADQ